MTCKNYPQASIMHCRTPASGAESPACDAGVSAGGAGVTPKTPAPPAGALYICSKKIKKPLKQTVTVDKRRNAAEPVSLEDWQHIQNCIHGSIRFSLEFDAKRRIDLGSEAQKS